MQTLCNKHAVSSSYRSIQWHYATLFTPSCKNIAESIPGLKGARFLGGGGGGTGGLAASKRLFFSGGGGGGSGERALFRASTFSLFFSFSSLLILCKGSSLPRPASFILQGKLCPEKMKQVWSEWIFALIYTECIEWFKLTFYLYPSIRNKMINQSKTSCNLDTQNNCVISTSITLIKNL